ncbi:hypothetical protein GCM10010363_05830 [Streptomyces omiyaensis]|nr:hypothetical protein GCM10010363_05830 [Streptomyces omiyaensis]
MASSSTPPAMPKEDRKTRSAEVGSGVGSEGAGLVMPPILPQEPPGGSGAPLGTQPGALCPARRSPRCRPALPYRPSRPALRAARGQARRAATRSA